MMNETLTAQELIDLENLHHDLKMERLEHIRETERLKHEWELERGRIKNAEYKKNLMMKDHLIREQRR